MAKFSKPNINPSMLKKEVKKKNDSLVAENKVLQKSIKSNKALCNKLNATLKKASIETEKAVEIMSAKYEEIDTLKGEVEIKQRQAADLVVSNQELVSKNNSLQVGLESEEFRLAVLEEKKNELKNELEEGKKLVEDNKELMKGSLILQKNIEALELKEKEVIEGYKIMAHEQKAKYDKFKEELEAEQNDILASVIKAREDRDKMEQDLKASITYAKSTIKKAKLDTKKEKAELEDSLLELRGESAALKSLITENKGKLQIVRQDYFEIEEKVRIAEKKIEDAKVGFENFKVRSFEEIAKLKLKGKLKTIDEAGLKDAFN